MADLTVTEFKEKLFADRFEVCLDQVRSLDTVEVWTNLLKISEEYDAFLAEVAASEAMEPLA